MAPFEDLLTPKGKDRLEQLAEDYRRELIKAASADDPDEITAASLERARKRIRRRRSLGGSEGSPVDVGDVLLTTGAAVEPRSPLVEWTPPTAMLGHEHKQHKVDLISGWR